MSTEWPFPGDSPVTRARKMAHAYRAELEKYNPDLVKGMDQRFTRWGERWHADEPLHDVGEDDWICTLDAAKFTGLAVGTLSALRTRGRLKGRLRKPRGRGFEFQVKELIRLSETPRGKGGRKTKAQLEAEKVAREKVDR